MIRGKIIIIFAVVIALTAFYVYHFTKQAYTPQQKDTPDISPSLSLPATTQEHNITSTALASQKEPNIQLEYAGADKSSYYAVLTFNMPKGTKTYWKKSGFGGINPEFDLSQSSNIKDYKIYWGQPKKHSASGFINYILPDNAQILIKIFPDNFSQPIHMKGVLNYGYCDIQCKAGTKNIDLTFDNTSPPALSASERYDILKKDPKALGASQTDVKIFDIKGKIDRKSHIISFTLESEKPFREENLFYSFDIDDYNIVQPLIQNIYEGRRRITIDMVGLGNTPKIINIIYIQDDETAIYSEHELTYERYN